MVNGQQIYDQLFHRSRLQNQSTCNRKSCQHFHTPHGQEGYRYQYQPGASHLMKRSCQQHTDHIRNPPFFHQKRQCDTKQHTHGKSLPESGDQIDIDQDRKGQKESCRLPSDKPVQEPMKQQHFGQSQHCNHNLERQSCRLKRPAKQPPANLRIKSTDISFGQVDHRRDRLIDCLIGRIIRALSEAQAHACRRQ